MAKLTPLSPDRLREVEVAGYIYQVPRHIVRLPVGWQVRFEGSAYFGDWTHGGVAESLEAACAHLVKTWRPIPKNTSRNQERSDAAIGPGIRYVVRDHKNGSEHWYIEATPPWRGTPKRFYIGTDTTMTDARENEAIKAARAQRKQWLAECPAPIR